jgi:hypothetical protein
MKLIRKGVFETNSSSTHSLVIPHKVEKEDYSLYDSLWHEYDFGRLECRLIDDWDEKLAYVYAMLVSMLNYKDTTPVEIMNFKKRINEIYKEIKEDKSIISKPRYEDLTPDQVFVKIDCDTYCCVDHAGDLIDSKEFLNKILNDDEFLKRFIFNKKSYITLGGDEYRGYNIKTIGFEYDYEDYYVNDKGERIPQEWYGKNGVLKSKYRNKVDEYNKLSGEFWDKLEEYKKDNDVFLKGN